MHVLPIMMRVEGRGCAVVGGGTVAARKAALLRRASAAVVVIAPELGPELQDEAAAGRVAYRPRAFVPADLDGITLVIAATDDHAVNEAVFAAADARGIPVNVVDKPELCRFLMPAIVDRSPLLVAISTGGASPVLARRLRARLETLIPANYGRLAALAERLRDTVARRLPALGARRRFWDRLFEGSFAELVHAGREVEAERHVLQALEGAPDDEGLNGGIVHLVGAGPGDPELLTLKALRVLQEADVILYDRLVSDAVLDLARRDAEKVFVGKSCGKHAMPQEMINARLVALARQGQRVVRLKGGDPFIFGRGGEEMEALAAAGITFEIVPGITAALGCAASTGIPLTHREHSHAVTFVTAHLKNGRLDLDWPALARPNQTLAVYMGRGTLDVLCERLIAHGLPAGTPAAVVANGTRSNQRAVRGTLATLPQAAVPGTTDGPALVIIGDVVRLNQDRTGWIERPASTVTLDEAA